MVQVYVTTAAHRAAPVSLNVQPVENRFPAMHSLRSIFTAFLFMFTLNVGAAPPLEQIMADPDWIGPPVEAAWPSLDGRQVFYTVKKAGSPVRTVRRIDLTSGQDEPVADADRARIDGDQPRYDRQRRRAIFLRHGDLFLRDLTSGSLRQLGSGVGNLTDARFAGDDRVHARSGERWLSIDIASGTVTPLADLRFEEQPDPDTPKDELTAVQLRLFETLRRQRDDRIAVRDEEQRLRAADGQRGPAPWYLGKDRQLVTSEPSADGRWLLLVTRDAKSDRGTLGKMPLYVTESGYTEIEDVRPRVGRNDPAGHQLELLDLHARTRHTLDAKTLPGIDVDPLADLRTARGDAAPKAPDHRLVTLMGARWNERGSHLALQLRSVDNKDRWLVTVDPARDPAALRLQHRLTDSAWINWSFNDFGWLPDDRTLWYLSEESGWSHLYVRSVTDRSARQLTRGEWEVHSPVAKADGSGFWFIANASHSAEFDLYHVGARGGEPRRLTSFNGVEQFRPTSDEQQLVVVHSSSYVPAQMAVVSAHGGTPRLLTDTRSAEYRALEWPPLDIVPVPSSKQDRPIWSKLYLPSNMEAGKRYPAVLFVHGAGYTQNTHRRFPYYFREQMFHQLLADRGFVVLDMDYRASAGYGRDWRTAIYRNMGHPELEDLVDGIDWLVANHQVDGERIGVYGGSYGGFMTLMAMFREPERFHAGAALRPVTDWRHYNHGYTANILNSPQLDPESHRISSPIEYAEGLAGHLLIAHGMLDDNVFYQDSVMLAQRLIELKKDNWELASYPLERHGYVFAESWLDQYRRILKLFERTLMPQVKQ